MSKDQSDVFICRLKKDDYWAYPSPFVAHGGGTEIQFRNLTDDPLEIDLTGLPVHRQTLSLPAGGIDFVIVNGDARAGFHAYRADVLLPAAAPVTRRGRTGKAGKPPRRRTTRKVTAPKTVRRVAVKGGSSPKIIVDA
jgi:hypothetical protein